MKPKGKFRQIIVTLLALLLSSYSLGGSRQQCNHFTARQCWLYKDAKATDSREAITYIYIYTKGGLHQEKISFKTFYGGENLPFTGGFMQNHRLPCLLLTLFPSAGGYWRLQQQVHM